MTKGGAREGSGRKPKNEKPLNNRRLYRFTDDQVITIKEAVETLQNKLTDLVVTESELVRAFVVINSEKVINDKISKNDLKKIEKYFLSAKTD